MCHNDELSLSLTCLDGFQIDLKVYILGAVRKLRNDILIWLFLTNQVPLFITENREKLPFSDQLSTPICLRNLRTALYQS